MTAPDQIFAVQPHPTVLAVSTFSYANGASADKAASLEWVAGSGVGHRLAQRIACLAAASRKNGGIGKVFVVAHSMGGLALRCALDTGCNNAAGGPVSGVGRDIAAAITFGTPNTGSFLRASSGLSRAASAYASVVSGTCKVLNIALQRDLASSAEWPTCDYINALANGSAAQAFIPTSPALAALKGLSANPPFPVRAVAGRVALTTSLGTLWHRTLNGDIGDLVVGTDSATAEARTIDGVGGALVEDCGSVDLSTVAAALSPTVPVVGVELLAKDLTAGLVCSHLNETSSSTFIIAALDTIGHWRDKHDLNSNTVRQLAKMPHATNPVSLPDGDAESAAWDDHGNVSFWRWTRATLSWRSVGTSRYPVLPASFGKAGAHIAGAMVNGGTDAIFIANGPFTGDGSGNAVAFGTGARGWGLLQQVSPDVLQSDAQRGTDNGSPGLVLAMKVVGGNLQTIEGNQFFATAAEFAFPLVSTWRWQSGHLVLVDRNDFTAQPAAPPGTSAAPWPAHGCASDGVYSAGLYADLDHSGYGHGLRLLVTTPAGTESPVAGCAFVVPSTMAMSVLASRGPRAPTPARWITAPAYLLDSNIVGLGSIGPYPIFPEEVRCGYNPYCIPASFDVNQFLSPIGNSYDASFQPQDATPTYATITIRGGKISTIALEPAG